MRKQIIEYTSLWML